jgi:hypothetical protein
MPRRPARRDIHAVSPAERQWARGELNDNSDAGFEVQFQTPAERLRTVWRGVAGSSVGAWLLRQPERWRLGEVLIYGARVGWLDEDGVRALRSGRDPWQDT